MIHEELRVVASWIDLIFCFPVVDDVASPCVRFVYGLSRHPIRSISHSPIHANISLFQTYDDSARTCTTQPRIQQVYIYILCHPNFQGFMGHCSWIDPWINHKLALSFSLSHFVLEQSKTLQEHYATTSTLVYKVGHSRNSSWVFVHEKVHKCLKWLRAGCCICWWWCRRVSPKWCPQLFLTLIFYQIQVFNSIM